MLGVPAPQLACSCVVGHIRACFHVFSLVLASSSASFCNLDFIPHFRPYFYDTLELKVYTVYLWHCFFKGCLDGGCEGKRHNARYSQLLQTGTGRRASFKTVPPPRDRLSSEGQSELISWWFVPDHIHDTSSSTPLLRYNRLALAVTLCDFSTFLGSIQGILLT